MGLWTVGFVGQSLGDANFHAEVGFRGQSITGGISIYTYQRDYQYLSVLASYVCSCKAL